MILSLLHVAVQMNPYSYITPNYFYVDYKRYFNVEPGIQRGASSNGCNVGRILLPCNCETLVSTIKSQLFQPSPAASRFIFHHFELCSNPFFCCSCPEYLWMKLALGFLMGLLFELHSILRYSLWVRLRRLFPIAKAKFATLVLSIQTSRLNQIQIQLNLVVKV